MQNQHQPVLVEHVVKLLLELDGDTFLDITLGGSGFFLRLLQFTRQHLHLYGIDLDPAAIRRSTENLKGKADLHFEIGNHADLERIARKWEVNGFNGIIADFGQSSEQIASVDGFSYRREAPLDLRYGASVGQTAAEMINNMDQKDIVKTIRLSGEKRAKKIAESIVKRRPLHTTTQLNEAIKSVCPSHMIEKTLARCYMALRCRVNQEHEAIKKSLPAMMNLLKPGGRVICLTYDSGQDKIVKDFMRYWSAQCVCEPGLPICTCNHKPVLKLLNRRVVKPDEQEIRMNRFSSSARLRAAERI